jgi:hypothetical protein
LDNPFFMQKMHAYIYDPANNVEFANYYDTNATTSGGAHVLAELIECPVRLQCISHPHVRREGKALQSSCCMR